MRIKSVFIFKLLTELVILLTTSFLLIIAPILYLINYPVGLARYVVLKSSKLLRPDLKGLVSPSDTIFFVQDTIFKRPKSSVMYGLVIQGNVDINSLRAKVSYFLSTKESILSSKSKLEYKLKYAKLFQCLDTWGRFYFWKEYKAFNIRQHVKLFNVPYSNKIFYDQEIINIWCKLLQKFWAKHTPLWEIVVVNNCRLEYLSMMSEDVQSVVFFRFHQCLSRGSLLKQFLNDLGCVELCKNEIPVNEGLEKETLLATCSNNRIKFSVKCAYEVSQLLIHSRLSMFFDSVPLWPVSDKCTVNIGFVNKISISHMLEVQNHFGVTFSSIIVSICTGAIRQFLTRRKSVEEIYSKVYCHVESEMNIKNGGFIMSLPLGEKDPKKRLQLCHQNTSTLSTFPVFLQYYENALGSYFPKAIGRFSKEYFIPVRICSFSGASKFSSLMHEHSCVDVFTASGLLDASTGLCICTTTYKGSLRISVIGDASILSQDDVNYLCRGIENQLVHIL